MMKFKHFPLLDLKLEPWIRKHIFDFRFRKSSVGQPNSDWQKLFLKGFQRVLNLKWNDIKLVEFFPNHIQKEIDRKFHNSFTPHRVSHCTTKSINIRIFEYRNILQRVTPSIFIVVDKGAQVLRKRIYVFVRT